MSADDIAELDIKEGASVVLDYLGAPMAVFDVTEIYEYDLERMAEKPTAQPIPDTPG